MKLKDVSLYVTRGYRKNLLSKKYKSARRMSIGTTFSELEIIEKFDWYSVGVSSIKDNIINTVSILYEPHRELEAFRLHNKDIIIPMIGSSFSPAIFDNMFPFYNPKDVEINKSFLISGNICLVEVDSKVIDPYYVFYVLSSDDTKKHLKRIAKGEKKTVITKDDILNIEIPRLSPFDEKRQTKLFKEELVKRGQNIKKQSEDKIVSPMMSFIKEADEVLKMKDINKMKEFMEKVHFDVPKATLDRYLQEKEMKKKGYGNLAG